MIVIESTPGCQRTPILLFALEEAGLPYQLRPRPNGYFVETYGVMGPALRDDEIVVCELEAPLRHIVRVSAALEPKSVAGHARMNAWLELIAATIRPAVRRAVRARQRGEDDLEAKQEIEVAVGVLEVFLGDRPFVAGPELTIADCMALLLGVLGRAGIALDRFPRLAAHLARIGSRPALARARARAGELSEVSS